MPNEQPIAHAAPAMTPEAGFERIERDEDWLEEPELPRRPRRRLLGVGGSASHLALLGVLLIACGFIGGVLVEKGQGSSAASGGAGGLAGRFAALRAGASATGARSGSSAGGAGAFPGGGSGGRTIGQVAYLAGDTLYVTSAEGNTVKVTTSPGTTVTRTVSTTVKRIHPGETVTVLGASDSGGVLSAESISVGASGSGLASLFGSAAGRSGGASSGSQPLFGNGG